MQTSCQTTNLGDLVERLLDKGIVISGDIRIKLCDVELLTIQIRLVICSVEKAAEIGLDWWNRESPMDALRDGTTPAFLDTPGLRAKRALPPVSPRLDPDGAKRHRRSAPGAGAGVEPLRPGIAAHPDTSELDALRERVRFLEAAAAQPAVGHGARRKVAQP